MKKTLLRILSIYIAVFVAFFIGTSIHIQLGSRKAILDSNNEGEKIEIVWDKDGPDVVPRNMKEAIEQLSKDIKKEDLERYRLLRTKSIGEMSMDEKMFLEGFGHFGLGMSMRNTWNLWFGSRLARWLSWRVGGHPDNMSSAISREFDHYLETGKIRSYWDDRFIIVAIFSTMIWIPLTIVYVIFILVRKLIKSNKALGVNSEQLRSPESTS